MTTSIAQTLSSGDVVVVGYNFKDPDEFSLLTLVDLLPGTQFCITDCGWDVQTNAFRPGEGLITFTVPSTGIPAGNQIHYPTDAGFVTQGVSGFFGLSVMGDQLLIFQGPFQSPHFLFGLTDFNGSWLNPTLSPNNQTSHLPPGLVEGQDALALDQYMQAHFECTFPFSNRQEFLSRLTDPSQWVKSVDRVILPILGCGFGALSEHAISWKYKIEGTHTIMLSVEQPDLYSDITWRSNEEGEEKAMTCQKQSAGVYVCRIEETMSDFLIRPCFTEICDKYKRIVLPINKEITCYYTEEKGCIEVRMEETLESFHYTLYDAKGRAIVNGQGHGLPFKVQGLSPGFYILSVELARAVYRVPIRILY